MTFNYMYSTMTETDSYNADSYNNKSIYCNMYCFDNDPENYDATPPEILYTEAIRIVLKNNGRDFICKKMYSVNEKTYYDVCYLVTDQRSKLQLLYLSYNKFHKKIALVESKDCTLEEYRLTPDIISIIKNKDFKNIYTMKEAYTGFMNYFNELVKDYELSKINRDIF
jgi:hypothetical protein